MKINKLNAMSVAVCCLVASLWSEAQCMDAKNSTEEQLRDTQKQYTEHSYGDLCKRPNECYRCDNYERSISNLNEKLSEGKEDKKLNKKDTK
jgi:hypothetical protein